MSLFGLYLVLLPLVYPAQTLSINLIIMLSSFQNGGLNDHTFSETDCHPLKGIIELFLVYLR